ncbi:MAG TPA: hypothetical protein VFE47_18780 [Tepidisphaeraceae bacterium]|jgi:hypothetical protein|nr:hypothetical protein [Tepidisphaeraceae bacterium]
MTMATIDRPSRRASSASASTNSAAAQRLRATFAAVRVNFTWFGTRKTLSAEQKVQAAEHFGAEGQYLSAAKKLLDNKHEAFQQVTAIRSQIISFWKSLSLPYPEPGVRLIRQEDVERFNARMTTFRQELADAVLNLDEHFEQLKAAAADRLGRLYNPADYPLTLRGLFAVDFDFPSVEPPEYLLRLNPHLYQQERSRITARFDEAVKLAEEAFVGEFSKLVSHLTERLTADPGGERKVFRDSAITNLAVFFRRFRSLNVRSNADLDRLVETAERILHGADPNLVRNSSGLRDHITSQLSAVQSHLDQMLVDGPRRRILRNRSAAGGNGEAVS